MEKRTKSWIVGLAGLAITIASVWSFCVFSSNGLTRKFIGNSEYISPIALTSRISRTTTTAIQDDAVASLTESSDQLNWKYYKNEDLHFSLSYPESLRPSTTKKERGLVASFSKFDEQAIDLGGEPNPSYFTQVRIYFWTDINDSELKGGNWEGEKHYRNITEFIDDSSHTYITKIAETTVAGQRAYVLSMPGEMGHEAVMFESNGGFFRITFSESHNSITEEQKVRLLKSFRLN